MFVDLAVIDRKEEDLITGWFDLAGVADGVVGLHSSTSLCEYLLLPSYHQALVCEDSEAFYPFMKSLELSDVRPILLGNVIHRHNFLR